MAQQLSILASGSTTSTQQSSGLALTGDSQLNQGVGGGGFFSEFEQAMSSEEFQEGLLATMPEGGDVAQMWQSLLASGKPLPEILSEFLATPEGEAHLNQLLSLSGENASESLVGNGDGMALLQYITAALGLEEGAEAGVGPALSTLRHQPTQSFLEQRGNPLLAAKGNPEQLAGSTAMPEVEATMLTGADVRAESGQVLKQVQDAVRQAMQNVAGKEGQLDLNALQNSLNQRAGGESGMASMAAMNNAVVTKAVTTAQPSATGLAGQAPTSTSINVPFGDARWGGELNNRIAWLAKDKIQSAEIRLNPERLGPVELRIEFKDDQARIVFSSQHAVVRDAIESAMPRLREMMNAQGLSLADAQVTDQSLHDRRQSEHEPGEHGDGGFAGGGSSSSADDELDSILQEGLQPGQVAASSVSRSAMNIDFYA